MSVALRSIADFLRQFNQLHSPNSFLVIFFVGKKALLSGTKQKDDMNQIVR